MREPAENGGWTLGDPGALEENPRVRWRPLLGYWFSGVTVIGLLLFTYHYLAYLAVGVQRSFLSPLINELTSAFGAGLLFFPLLTFVHRFPLDRPGWQRRVLLYPVMFVIFSTLHTTSNWVLRSLLYPVAGLGPYDYGKMPMRYFMEAPMGAIVITVMVAGIHGARHLQRSRARELRAARLEQSLSQATLHNLRLQLQPHFLFNALNTISATMYRDVKAADKMIESLGDLLRASLRTTSTDEVALATELDGLDCYLAIMRARFGERLRVDVEVDADARRCLVPSTLLQPLVENAVRHGGAERSGSGHIRIRAVKEAGSLVMTVHDDGPGAPHGADTIGSGIGLRATAERLRLLYGERQRFTAGNDPQGGFRVEVRIPFSTDRASAA